MDRAELFVTTRLWVDSASYEGGHQPFLSRPGDRFPVAALDKKVSAFFDHRDPAMVQWIGSRKLKG